MKKLMNHIISTKIGKISLSVMAITILMTIIDLIKINAYFKSGYIFLPIFIFTLLFCILFICAYRYPKVALGLNVFLCILMAFTTIVTFRASSFSSAITNSGEVEVLEIVVKKDSKLTPESSLDDKVMGAFIDDEIGLERAREILEEHKKTNVQEKRYDDMNTAYDDLMNGKIDMLVYSSNSTSYFDEEKDHRSGVKVLFSKEYHIEKILEESNVDILTEPFVMYLGGVDLSSNGKINGNGRGDVNILMAVNPNTKKVILQVIPRDLYAYNPVKKKCSKLSWSGKWGGIQSSVYSIQHELGIKIDYYAKISFDGFVDLVDAVGGVDVYSHYTYTAQGFYFEKGINHVNGEQALVMARERKSLPLNERSRGLQQMEIIKGILRKFSENPSFNHMMNLLDAIQDNFMTSIPEDKLMDVLTLFLSMQDQFLNMESYSMEGDIQWHDDEIIGGYYYYFYPAEGEIEKVRNRINDVLLGK